MRVLAEVHELDDDGPADDAEAREREAVLVRDHLYAGGSWRTPGGRRRDAKGTACEPRHAPSSLAGAVCAVDRSIQWSRDPRSKADRGSDSENSYALPHST